MKKNEVRRREKEKGKSLRANQERKESTKSKKRKRTTKEGKKNKKKKRRTKRMNGERTEGEKKESTK